MVHPMTGNWLETLGGWLSKQLVLIFGPWWREQVRKQAESVESREKLLKAIVRFRLRDCERRKLIGAVK